MAAAKRASTLWPGISRSTVNSNKKGSILADRALLFLLIILVRKFTPRRQLVVFSLLPFV